MAGEDRKKEGEKEKHEEEEEEEARGMQRMKALTDNMLHHSLAQAPLLMKGK